MNAEHRPTTCIAIPVDGATRARIAEECEIVGFDEIMRADGLLGSAQMPVDAAFIDRATRLRVVSNFGVGYNNVDLDAATRRGILVCNTPGVLSDAVADLTLAMILAMSRRLVDNALYARDGGWSARRPSPPLGIDVAGKTLGIVGFGRIGRAVARRAHVFGMRVLFHDVLAGIDGGDSEGTCERCAMDDLLQRSDFVSLHVNLTAETHHRIGARELALMKPTAYLINTARGPVIDQAALVVALREGTIAGAALDVLEVEPPAASEPILSLPNVLVLPHIGSATIETRAAMLDLAVTNLLAALRGDEPPCCVNPEARRHAVRG